MTIGIHIQDPHTSNRARVDSEGAVVFTERLTPPFGFPTIQVPLTQFLTADGTPTGSNDMRVAGTLAAPIEFSIEAVDFNDRYISVVSFFISDAGSPLDRFGNLPALTNGCRFYWKTDLGEFEIDNITTNFELIRLGLGSPAFGDSGTAMILNNVVSQSDAYIPTLDFRLSFGFQHGIRLLNGSTERLVMQIRDNITAIDSFNAKCFGFDRLPDPSLREAVSS